MMRFQLQPVVHLNGSTDGTWEDVVNFELPARHPTPRASVELSSPPSFVFSHNGF